MLIIIIILFILIINGSYEHYSDRLANTTLDECATFCKTTENCYGFGYNKFDNTCFPSTTLIEGKPDSLYRDLYLPTNVACNKIQPIVTPRQYIPFDDRRKNSIYVCKEAIDKQPAWYLHQHNKLSNIGEGKNIDEIYNIDSYNVQPYKWPINKYNPQQLDLLIRDRLSNQMITKINQTQQINDILIALPKPVTNKSPTYDFGLSIFQ